MSTDPLTTVKATLPELTPTDQAAVIKLRIFRQIDQLSLDELTDLASYLDEAEANPDEVDYRDLATQPEVFSGDIDQGYSMLAADEADVSEGIDWSEAVHNTEEL